MAATLTARQQATLDAWRIAGREQRQLYQEWQEAPADSGVAFAAYVRACARLKAAEKAMADAWLAEPEGAR